MASYEQRNIPSGKTVQSATSSCEASAQPTEAASINAGVHKDAAVGQPHGTVTGTEHRTPREVETSGSTFRVPVLEKPRETEEITDDEYKLAFIPQKKHEVEKKSAIGNEDPEIPYLEVESPESSDSGKSDNANLPLPDRNEAEHDRVLAETITHGVLSDQSEVCPDERPSEKKLKNAKLISGAPITCETNEAGDLVEYHDKSLVSSPENTIIPISKRFSTSGSTSSTRTERRASNYSVSSTRTERRASDHSVSSTRTEKRASDHSISSTRTEKRGSDHSIRITRTEKRESDHSITSTRTEKRGSDYSIKSTHTERTEKRGSGHSVSITRREKRGSDHSMSSIRTEKRGSDHSISITRTEKRGSDHNMSSTRTEKRGSGHSVTETGDDFGELINATENSQRPHLESDKNRLSTSKTDMLYEASDIKPHTPSSSERAPEPEQVTVEQRNVVNAADEVPSK
ncbi:hypothetical protein MRX96_022369 [Rhipicephalus microplus]